MTAPVFASRQMQAVLSIIEQIKDSSVPVMILGESGTGKEVVARELHRRGNRAHKPCVTVNCAAVPGQLADSELFGHEKGAFTGATAQRKGRFEEADGGTLFLDEVGELDVAIQAKLLRVLQEKEVVRVGGNLIKVDARIIVATHKDLTAEVRAGRFREDLYHRLNVITIPVAPLRSRVDEIPELAQHLLDRFTESEGLPARTLTDAAIEALVAHHWTGNVRELQNVMKRSVLLSSAPVIDRPELVFHGASAMNVDAIDPATVEAVRSESVPPPGPVSLESFRAGQKDEMLAALAKTGGNVSEAARRLGIGRATFYRRAKRFGIETN